MKRAEEQPFRRPISAGDVQSLIDLTVAESPGTRSMATLQEEGIAALYGILCSGPVAFLADEVGMGKTYQALGLAALLWNEKPDARILFVVPNEMLQGQWVDAYRGFFASNYRRPQGIGDDRVSTVLFREPIYTPERHANLREWALTIGRSERRVPFLRHSSFTRPIFVGEADYADLKGLWGRTRLRMKEFGLFEAEAPTKRLDRDNASRELNVAFAKALSTRLARESGGRPYFDLVIVDESQCLRNPDNQTNSVLHAVLHENAAKWLFLSATPAHGGPGDIPRIMNRYPRGGQQLPESLAGDAVALQRAMQGFVVRRQRSYLLRDALTKVGKHEYRAHDVDGWAVKDEAMNPVGALAIALVQKGLVKVLEEKNNRFRLGFLSSFESLQASLSNALGPSRAVTPADEAAGGDERAGDWHVDTASRTPEPEAPDTNLVATLAKRYEEAFGEPLPHPKVDHVVDRVAREAFGTPEIAGGRKFLIFVRRVSTVEALRARLDRRYHEAVAARIQRCWGERLDWERGAGGTVEDPLDDVDDPEADDASADSSPIRRAMARGGWLFRFRQTFRTTGRNNLVFEDGWLRRLCRAGGVSPAEAASRVPDELWAESWQHGSRASGAKVAHHRADRVRYLAVQLIRRHPDVFGMDQQRARPWREAYELILRKHLKEESLARNAERRVATELFTEHTLWDQWDESFSGSSPLSLPVSNPQTPETGDLIDLLCQRAVTRTMLEHAFRLTDTLVDLYFADRVARTPGQLAATFVTWLRDSTDPGAETLRRDCEGWVQQRRLIADSCLEGRGVSWRELALRDNLRVLDSPSAVAGVVGGMGPNLQVTRQFRTPSLPRVIVCTDTLKQGVDLHTFCDSVLQYGVAWTSGDLEQRVGRVDRYFSQIERRLATEGARQDVHLHVGYPHIHSSLERHQVELVRERQVAVERLMDSPLAMGLDEPRDVIAGALVHRTRRQPVEPFAPRQLPSVDRGLDVVTADAAEGVRRHYVRWTTSVNETLERGGWRVTPRSELPLRTGVTIQGPSTHELEWRYDAPLRRYVMTVARPEAGSTAVQALCRRRRIVQRQWVDEELHTILVPTPDEGVDQAQLDQVVAALRGHASVAARRPEAEWDLAFSAVSNAKNPWRDKDQATLTIRRSKRKHRVSVRVHEGQVHVSGTIADVDDLGERPAWGGKPTLENVQGWARRVTAELTLGCLDVSTEGKLVFVVHVHHPRLSDHEKQRLLQEIAWRADAWEAALTGEDHW